MRRRGFFIGLDGATFDVLTPLMKDGWMPNLKNIVECGAYGNMESTIPATTGPAWLSLATGLSPDKTGVFDFRKYTDSHSLKLISSADYYKKSIWDFFSEQRKKVGVFNYPMLFPPTP